MSDIIANLACSRSTCIRVERALFMYHDVQVVLKFRHYVSSSAYSRKLNG